MEMLELKAYSRDQKASLKKLKKEGKIPAVLYGHNVKNQSLFIDLIEFEKIHKKSGDSTIINLMVDEKDLHPVLIQDTQDHYISARPIHVDFYQVSMSQKLKTAVHLEFIGEAPAVKALGGTLVKVADSINIECLPADLPHSIAIDISTLATFQDSIIAKNIKLPAKVTLITNGDDIIAKVQPPRDVEAELSTPVVEDVSKVEGAAENKPQEETAKKDSSKSEAQKS